MPNLFTPLTISGTTFANRAWVSPMCQYSATDGVVGDWHLMHIGQFAAGGAGLVMMEATGVSPEARISTHCPGLWNDEQQQAWSRVVDFAHSQDTLVGIQLAHAGRKASTAPPWSGRTAVPESEGGWQAVAPSAVAFGNFPVPRTMTKDDIEALVHDFAQAARRALAMGVDVVELHAAHGYLMHQFLSPLSNRRNDEFGGSLDNRMRVPLAVAAAIRTVWPSDRPLFARISTTDWVPGGWDLEQSIVFAKELKEIGVDLIDASSAGLVLEQQVPADVSYQTDFAAVLRARTGVFVAGVGRITNAHQADALISSGAVDAVFLARQFLRDPHWALRAAHELGVDVEWRPQYRRAADWNAL